MDDPFSLCLECVPELKDHLHMPQMLVNVEKEKRGQKSTIRLKHEFWRGLKSSAKPATFEMSLPAIMCLNQAINWKQILHKKQETKIFLISYQWKLYIVLFTQHELWFRLHPILHRTPQSCGVHSRDASSRRMHLHTTVRPQCSDPISIPLELCRWWISVPPRMSQSHILIQAPKWLNKLTRK